MAAWDEFTKLATAGSYAQAVQWLDTHDSKLAFDATFALAVGQPAAWQGLWDSVPYQGEKVSDFALDLVYYGQMPQKTYGNMTWGDYDNAREVYLRAWEKTKRPTTWPTSRHTNSTSVCLFPEYRFGRTLRASILQLCTDQVGSGPGDQLQANLFCLGGRYTYSIGMQGANPRPPGTTCMLFARSILHAVGINVIGPHTKTWCGCDDGMRAELQHIGCYVNAKTASSIPAVKPGDIFEIQGPNFKNGAQSVHVGVIVAVAGNKWTCIQGGASDHVTKRVTYTVVSSSSSMGKWTFQEDFASVNMTRPLQGYWSIDSIGDGFLMKAGPYGP
jgi:hypothetical protein